MIHINEVIKALKSKGNYKVVCHKKNGDAVTLDNVERGKYYHRGGMIKYHLTNGQIREMRTVGIVEFNDIEVCL